VFWKQRLRGWKLLQLLVAIDKQQARTIPKQLGRTVAKSSQLRTSSCLCSEKKREEKKETDVLKL
jgi:hypothetical protein